jgi:uncharacterized protein (TIGR03437 family)
MARNIPNVPAFNGAARLIKQTLLVMLVFLLGPMAWGPASSVSSQSALPPGFTETLVTGGLNLPTAMAVAPDGRIFVCQQSGQLRVIKNDALLSTPFLSLTVPQDGERGLLGVAVDPDFAVNQYIYVYYTVPSPIHHRVSRFTANGDVAAAGSETLIFSLNDTSNSAFHNGGSLHFGPDKKLYIATGDNSIGPNSQTLNNLLGKILRINQDGTIPADNPFFNQATGNNRAIWAMGLRNPFTFAIQPGTSRLFINDVGSASREEINDGIAGGNYGWPNCEGPCNPPNAAFRDPIHSYPRVGGAGGDCAITGGTFYNPAAVQFPAEYVGVYFFADYCSGKIRRLNPSTGSVTDFTTVKWPVNLQAGPDGSLYYFSFFDGKLLRIRYDSANQGPQIATHPSARTAAAGQPVSFSVSASGTSPLSYQWQRNMTNIGGATGATYTIAATAAGDNGAKFRCVVTNAFGTATSNEATLTITSNQPPVATISTPVAGTLYRAGQTISFTGTGTDPETGALPASAFTWRVDFHHDDHLHPHMPSTTGATGGSTVIPTIGETATNVWYRIHLTVKDSAGLTHSVFRDVSPQLSTFTLATTPANLQLTLDGTPVASPVSVQSVVGVTRELGVVSPQTAGGKNYLFSAWSDGGAMRHTIATPAANTTYTANFTQVPPLSSVSAASYAGATLAAESIVAAFGSGLAQSTASATAQPLPTILAGARVMVLDSAGVERPAPLFFVSPTQINYQVPAGTAKGKAFVRILGNNQVVAGDFVQIETVAPGLFSANSSGRGLLIGLVLRVKADNTRSYEPIVRFNTQTQQMAAVPIDLGPATDQVFLLIFATGARFRSSLSAVNVTIGGVTVQTSYAGPQGDFVGLDQLNVLLSRSLAGRGDVDVTVSVDNAAANPLRISIK